MEIEFAYAEFEVLDMLTAVTTLLLVVASCEPDPRDPRETYVGAMEFAITTLQKEDYETFLDRCLSQTEVKEHLRKTSRKDLLRALKNGNGKSYMEALKKARKLKPTRLVSASNLFRVRFTLEDESEVFFTQEEDGHWYMSF